jgi:YD repeat-containing protein
VTYPNQDGSGNHGEETFSYTSVSLGGSTFTPAGMAGQITEIQALQSAGNWVVTGLFSYTSPASGAVEVIHLASGVVSGTLQRELSLSYTLCQSPNSSTTSATLNGGTKTITSTASTSSSVPVQRITQIVATAGSGASGEGQGTIALTWNSNLTLASSLTGAGRLTTLAAYDSRGNPTTIEEGTSSNPTMRTTTLTYSTISRPFTVTRLSVDGVHNHVVTFDYDSDYNTTYNQSPTAYLHQIVDQGYTDTTLSGSLGSLQTRTTQVHYDSSNRVTSKTGPLTNESTTMAYWPTGSGYATNRLKTVAIQTSLTPAYLTTTYSTFDADGRLLSYSDPNSASHTMTLDPQGRVLTSTITEGSNSAEWSWAYDLAGDLLTKTTPEGETVKREYDAALRMWREHSENSSTIPWSRVTDFDSWGRPITERRFGGSLGSDLGSGCTSSSSEEACFELAYDAMARLSTRRTLDSSNNVCTGQNCTNTFAYDNDGILNNQVEAGLNTTSYQLDALGRITQITLPTTKYSTIAYDINDRPTQRWDPKSSVNGGSGGTRLTTYLNDDFGQLLKVVSPDIGTWLRNYDAAGDLYTEEDALASTTTYSYDLARRRTQVQPPVSSDAVSYTYDETGTIGGVNYTNTTGRLTSIAATDPSSNHITQHYSYDFLGRVVDDVSERGASGSLTYADTHYAWGLNGELTSMTYPDGLVVTNSFGTNYAPVPRPNAVATSTGNLLSGVTYFGDGLEKSFSWSSFGGTRTLTRNKRDEITRVTSGNISGNPILDQSFEYDSNGIGLMTKVHYFPGASNAWDWTMGYDNLHRLTSFTTSVRPTTDNYTWNYDEVNNRTSQVYNSTTTSYAYDAAGQTNQLQSTTLSGVTSSYAYDADGSRKTYNPNSANTYPYYTYAYDGRHQMNAFNWYNSSGVFSTLETYNYDGRGRRWQKASGTIANTWTQFYYDLWGHVIQTYTPSSPVNGCSAYAVTDLIYLNGAEVGRVTRSFQGMGTCAPSTYSFLTLEQMHTETDARRSPWAIDDSTGLLGESEYTPTGGIKTWARPGPDGKIGTSDDLGANAPNSFAADAAWSDSESGLIADLSRSIVRDINLGQFIQPGAVGGNGSSPYGQAGGGYGNMWGVMGAWDWSGSDWSSGLDDGRPGFTDTLGVNFGANLPGQGPVSTVGLGLNGYPTLLWAGDDPDVESEQTAHGYSALRLDYSSDSQSVDVVSSYDPSLWSQPGDAGPGSDPFGGAIDWSNRNGVIAPLDFTKGQYGVEYIIKFKCDPGTTPSMSWWGIRMASFLHKRPTAIGLGLTCGCFGDPGGWAVGGGIGDSSGLYTDWRDASGGGGRSSIPNPFHGDPFHS